MTIPATMTAAASHPNSANDTPNAITGASLEQILPGLGRAMIGAFWSSVIPRGACIGRAGFGL